MIGMFVFLFSSGFEGWRVIFVPRISNLVPMVEKEPSYQLFHIRGWKMKQNAGRNMGSDGGEAHRRDSEKEAPSRKVGSRHPPHPARGSVMPSMQTHACPQKI